MGKLMQKYEDVDEFYELWGWLLQAAWTLFEVRNKELESHGITTMQAAALFFTLSVPRLLHCSIS